MLYFGRSAQFYPNLYLFFSLTWVDVFLLLIAARTIIVSLKHGFVKGLYNVVSVVLIIILAIHSYIPFGYLLNEKLLVPESIKDSLAFYFLVIVFSLVFYCIRKGWNEILDVKLHPLLDEWGGYLLSFIRTYLLCACVFMGLLLAGDEQYRKNSKSSLSGRIFGVTAGKIYQVFAKSFVVYIAPDDTINYEVYSITDNF